VAFLPLPPIAAILQGENTAGESTDLASQAAQSAQEIPEQTGTVLSLVRDFFAAILGYLFSTEFVANVVATLLVVALALVFYRLAIRLIPRILRRRRPSEEEAPDGRTLARIRRQDTAVTLLRNALRYATFAIVTLFVLSVFLRNSLPTIAGASVLAAIAGFAARDFLRDIIAGFFTLFEGLYNVGDFIEVEPTKASGLVEEFGLRTTKIRALSGEIMNIPNGTITGVTNYHTGQQSFTIEVHLKDPEAAERVLAVVQEESQKLYLKPPHLVERDELAECSPRLRFSATVLPSTAWLVEENLVERIKAVADEEGLAGEPLVYKVDEREVQRLKRIVDSEQN
jgi:moderate conductance mechanosensitive channel